MPNFGKRMRDGMDLLHVNDDDRMSLEEVFAPTLAGRKKEQILEELKEWSADGDLWDDDDNDT